MFYNRLIILCQYVCLPIIIISSAYADDMDELIVTATRQNLSTNQITSSTTIFTAEQIQKRGIQQLSELLRTVPGFAVSQNGAQGTLTDIRVRGAEANHTLVLIDGNKANNPANGNSFDFGHFPVSHIARVEILRGPQGVLWGSDAIGAVINIITKSGHKKTNLAFSSSAGTRATTHNTVNFNYKKRDIDLNFNTDIFSTNGTNTARTGNEQDGFLARTYTIKLRAQPTKRLSAVFSGLHNNAMVQTDPQIWPNAQITDEANNSTYTEQTYLQATLKYGEINDFWRQNISIAKNNTKNDFQSTVFGPSFSDGQHHKYTYESHITFNNSAHIPIQQDISFLLEYQDERAMGTFLGGRQTVGITTKSYILQYQIGLLERLYFSTGIRLEDHNLFKNVNTYQLSSSYDFWQTATKLKINYATGIKHPTLFELYGDFPNFFGDPNLRPEYVRGWDISIEQQLTTDSHVAMAYFTNLIEDLIVGSARTVRNNPGISRIEGMELSVGSQWNKHLMLTGSYTYTDPRDSAHRFLIRRAQHIAAFNAHYTPNQRFTFNLDIVYNGKQTDSVFSTTESIVTLDAYTVVNLAANYKINNQLSLYTKISNLFDTSYEEVYSYRAPRINGQIGIRFRLDPLNQL